MFRNNYDNDSVTLYEKTYPPYPPPLHRLLSLCKLGTDTLSKLAAGPNIPD